MKNALIVLDMINDIVHPEGKIPSCATYVMENKIINKINELIKKFKEAKLPVFFVKIAFEPDYSDCPDNSPMFSTIREKEALKNEEWGTNFVEGLEIDNNDTLIIKKNVSAFTSNDLLNELRSQNITDITVVGVSLNNAVKQTLNDGCLENFKGTLVPECCGASNAEVFAETLSLLRETFKIESLDSINLQTVPRFRIG